MAIDENDSNFVDEGEGVAGEVDVVKVANEGVGRIDVVDRGFQENM